MLKKQPSIIDSLLRALGIIELFSEVSTSNSGRKLTMLTSAGLQKYDHFLVAC
jgi:hypothetical protein